MNELIERYVYQVGLYVRPKERADIETELRSQIQDQLEDRYGGSPSQAEIAAVLKQLGDPRTMAASYSGEQYLVGPDLYPFMLTVLRIGMPLIPAVVVIANISGALLSSEGGNWLGLLIESAFTAGQAAVYFFAIVVLIFAILQHSGEELRAAAKTEFNPLELPPVNDPASVDRMESGIGIAFGALATIAVAYWLQVGGLTLRFNVSDPGDVLPAPAVWLIALLITSFASILLNLWALVRRRWNPGMWLAQTLVDVLGVITFYFAVLIPVAERLSLTQVALPIALVTIVLIALVGGFKLIRMWQQRQGITA